MAKKIDLMELYAFIVRFHADTNMTPGTAILANKFKVIPKTVRENLQKLKEEGRINYEDTGKYNTRYSLK